jgi:mannose-6-phosphate isomerase-like protein (cupin superfamily)
MLDSKVRTWGYWKVLLEYPNIKVKELIVEPGKSLSDQRHSSRSEHWYILSGELNLKTENGVVEFHKLHTHDSFIIPIGTWHKATNIGNVPCHILEVQYGKKCSEDDIERRD